MWEERRAYITRVSRPSTRKNKQSAKTKQSKTGGVEGLETRLVGRYAWTFLMVIE